jgi:hypothetical protein
MMKRSLSQQRIKLDKYLTDPAKIEEQFAELESEAKS